MTIVNAQIRLADEKEKSQAQSSCLVKALKAPFNYVNTRLTSLNMWRNSHDTLQWQPPLVQKVYDAFMYTIGLNPSYGAIETRSSTLGVTYDLKDPTLVRIFYELHRNGEDGIFGPNKSMTAIAEFLKKCFPGTKEEDFIGTCGNEQTDFLHTLLKNKLNVEAVQANAGMINGKVKKFIKEMADSEKAVNFNEIARRYSSEVVGELLFNDAQVGAEIGELVVDFKSYLIRVFMKTLTPEDAKFADKVTEVVRTATQKILEDPKKIPLFQDSDMTVEEMKAMILLVIMAAQDNTATLLTALVAHLVKLPDERMQQLKKAAKEHLKAGNEHPFVFPTVLNQYLKEVMSIYPPVPLVARAAKNDIVILYQLKGEWDWRRQFIPKGSAVAARMIDIRERYFGEKGPHTCPGQYVAILEAKLFLCALLADFDMMFVGDTNFHIESQVTANLRPNVMLSIFEEN